MDKKHDYTYALEIMNEQLKNKYISPEIKYAFEASIDALKRQIPASPKLKSWSPALCPTCSTELSESTGDGYYKHYESLEMCRCGQKLKWQ